MSVNGIGQNYYQNYMSTNKYNRSKAGQFFQQKQAAEASAPEGAKQNANVQDIYKALKNGIPDYSFTVGDSMYIDRAKAQWAQYMNPLGAKFYSAEEMAKMKAELIEKNTATAHKLSDPYSILYKKLHPEYNGERIFCEYPGGPLYTADEIMEIMNRNSQDAKYQAEARKNNN